MSPSIPPFTPLVLLPPDQIAAAQTIAAYCRQTLDFGFAASGSSPAAAPAATYVHLPLCVLHAVWSPHVRAQTVQHVVARYAAHFGLTGDDGEPSQAQPSHTIRDFVCAVEEKGVDAFAADVLQNRQRTGQNGITKAEAAYRFALALQSHQVQTVPDIVPRLRGCAAFEHAVLQIPGQKSGAVLRHFYRLCGAHELAPFDPLLAEFVARVAGRPVPQLSEAQTLLLAACHLLQADFPGLTPFALYDAILRRETNAATVAAVVSADTAPVFVPGAFPPAIPSPAPLPAAPPVVQSTVNPTLPPPEEPAPPPAPAESHRDEEPKAEENQAETGSNTESNDDEEAASYRVRLREIPADDRPRERLLQYGADVLSLGELLAILLRSGTQQQNVVELANHLLSQHGGLRGVATLTPHELAQINGIGPAKAAQIKAAIEFGRRLVAASPEERAKISSPRDVYHQVGPALRDEKREHFIALLLDTKNGLLRQMTISVGDLSSSLVHPREVFAPAIRHSAASLIVAHNHPSGDPTPSPEDIQVTARLVEAGELLGIPLLDHIVVGDAKWASLKEKGLM